MKQINRLDSEKSLYLKQHADNPVFWYPWGDEAFAEAERSNKPIMLSIGYSACHWCHVMAHESFEDQETADILNNNFINIKVDREERPDIDKIYQMSQSIITGKNGGWPLTIFMDHEKFPFFGGTYFPKEDKYGMLSFKKILARVTEFYENNKEDIKNQNLNVLEVFKRLNLRETKAVKINHDIVDKLKLQLDSITDTINGGFGSAPKFPQFPSLSFCINNSSTKLENKKIKHTLDRMCTSGINDCVDGGFYRYSVDDLWMIPHFEKMLYDNGPMMSILCDSYVKFGDTLYIDKAKEIYNWARIFMTSEEGVFYSTIDADSEGLEGKYYVFSDDELKKTLEKEEIDMLNEYLLDLNKPNFEGNHHLHLHRKKEDDFKENKKKFMPIFKKLSASRKQKVLPSVDKKVLLSWNCLYIKGLIKLYKITKEENIYKAINEALDFITNRMVSSETIYSCFNEQPCFPGYLDDYALLGSVLIDYLSIEWNQNYYDNCMRVCDDLINNFEDKDKGGFFFTSNQHEQLFYRPKSISDDSVPSGLVYATDTLLYMGFISGNQKYIEAAHGALDFIYKSIDDNLTSSVSAINLLREDNLEKEIIIVRTNKKIWEKITDSEEYYGRCIIFIENELQNLPDYLAYKESKGEFTSYHCKGMTCQAPKLSFENFIDALKT